MEQKELNFYQKFSLSQGHTLLSSVYDIRLPCFIKGNTGEIMGRRGELVDFNLYMIHR